MTSHTIIEGDAATALKTLPNGCVHLGVTSCPYDDLRTYGKEKVSWDFETIAKELYRVLCPGGVLCWNVNDQVVNGGETLTSCKQKIYFVEQCGFRVHDTMIYEKRNFSHPEKVRYHQVFEYVYVLSKGAPRAFNPIKDKKNATAGCIGNLGVNTYTERDGTKSVREKKLTAEYGMRTNVWMGNTRGQEDMCIPLKHPAMMPKWLARDLILSWSNAGDIVIDPFMGSGTTIQQAEATGRSGIGIEINPEYIRDFRQNLDLNNRLNTGTTYEFRRVLP